MRTGILASMLGQLGNEALWWTSTFDHYNRRHRFAADTRVEVTPRFRIQYLRGRGYRRNVSLGRLLDNRDVARRFSRLARREPVQPDVILASLPTAELALEAVRYGRGRGVPVVIDVRDLWPDTLYEQVPTLLKPFARALLVPMARATREVCQQADAITGVTEPFVDWALRFAARDRRSADRAFPMGYIRNELPRQRLEQAERFWNDLGVRKAPGSLIVAFFGTLGRMFDLGPVIEAARLFRSRDVSVRFVLCGDGESAAEYREKARGLDNVCFPGWVQEEHIRTLLGRADVGLAPYIRSANFIHNIANKPAEYLSGGLPIALSLGGGVLFDLVQKNDCGFSYHNRAADLFERLAALHADPERLARMSANAGDLFSRMFDGKVTYPSMIRHLEEIVAGEPRRTC